MVQRITCTRWQVCSADASETDGDTAAIRLSVDHPLICCRAFQGRTPITANEDGSKKAELRHRALRAGPFG
jgi:hypothetical protein